MTNEPTSDRPGSDVKDRRLAQEVIPVVEEQAVVVKRRVLADGVRLSTIVHEREDVVDEPLATEEIEVERVPLDLFVDAPVPIREDGETTIITLLEEVVVVEKRLRAIEEIRITRRRSVRREPERVKLRREEAIVERLRANGGPDEPDQDPQQHPDAGVRAG